MKPVETWTIGRLLDTAAGYLKEKGSPSARLDAELLLADTPASGAHPPLHPARPPADPGRGDRLPGARRAARGPRAGGLHPRPGLLPASEPGGARRRAHPAAGDRGTGRSGAGDAAARPAWGELLAGDRAGGAAGQCAPSPAARAGSPTIVDVGTGSGAIALSLAQEAGVRVLAIDASREALAVAARERRGAGSERPRGVPRGRPAGRRRRRRRSTWW